MSIDADAVRRIAALAELELSEDEIERMGRDLAAILELVEKLDALDTSEVAPTTHVLELETPLRRDEVAGVLDVAEVVRNAPEHTDSAMVVPKVLE